MEKGNSTATNQINLSFSTKFGLILLGCVGVYLIISLHFLLAVRIAHFLGDPTYLPPSVLRYTAIFYSAAEVSAVAEIVFLVIWLAFLGFSCWGMFKAALIVIKTVGLNHRSYFNCFKSAFYALLPILILTLITLSITPLQDHKYGTASMSEIAETIPFTVFLSAMDEATIAIFGVTLFVVITLATAMLVTKILPDNAFMFFAGIFVGVLIGVGVMMFLMPLAVQGFSFIKHQTGNSYLSHFVLFGIYSFVSAVLILLTEKKSVGEKLPA